MLIHRLDNMAGEKVLKIYMLSCAQCWCCFFLLAIWNGYSLLLVLPRSPGVSLVARQLHSRYIAPTDCSLTIFSTPLRSVNRVQSMVLALLLTLVASALAQTFPRGPDPPGSPNNIFSYAQKKTDPQFEKAGTPTVKYAILEKHFFADPR